MQPRSLFDDGVGALVATGFTSQSLNGVGAGRYRPAPYRDSDPPDPSAGIECFTVTDDEKSTVSPSVKGPKAPQSGGSGRCGRRMGRLGTFSRGC